MDPMPIGSSFLNKTTAGSENFSVQLPPGLTELKCTSSSTDMTNAPAKVIEAFNRWAFTNFSGLNEMRSPQELIEKIRNWLAYPTGDNTPIASDAEIATWLFFIGREHPILSRWLIDGDCLTRYTFGRPDHKPNVAATKNNEAANEVFPSEANMKTSAGSGTCLTATMLVSSSVASSDRERNGVHDLKFGVATSQATASSSISDAPVAPPAVPSPYTHTLHFNSTAGAHLPQSVLHPATLHGDRLTHDKKPPMVGSSALDSTVDRAEVQTRDVEAYPSLATSSSSKSKASSVGKKSTAGQNGRKARHMAKHPYLGPMQKREEQKLQRQRIQAQLQQLSEAGRPALQHSNSPVSWAPGENPTVISVAQQSTHNVSLMTQAYNHVNSSSQLHYFSQIALSQLQNLGNPSMAQSHHSGHNSFSHHQFGASIDAHFQHHGNTFPHPVLLKNGTHAISSTSSGPLASSMPLPVTSYNLSTIQCPPQMYSHQHAQARLHANYYASRERNQAASAFYYQNVDLPQPQPTSFSASASNHVTGLNVNASSTTFSATANSMPVTNSAVLIRKPAKPKRSAPNSPNVVQRMSSVRTKVDEVVTISTPNHSIGGSYGLPSTTTQTTAQIHPKAVGQPTKSVQHMATASIDIDSAYLNESKSDEQVASYLLVGELEGQAQSHLTGGCEMDASIITQQGATDPQDQKKIPHSGLHERKANLSSAEEIEGTHGPKESTVITGFGLGIHRMNSNIETPTGAYSESPSMTHSHTIWSASSPLSGSAIISTVRPYNIEEMFATVIRSHRELEDLIATPSVWSRGVCRRNHSTTMDKVPSNGKVVKQRSALKVRAARVSLTPVLARQATRIQVQVGGCDKICEEINMKSVESHSREHGANTHALQSLVAVAAEELATSRTLSCAIPDDGGRSVSRGEKPEEVSEEESEFLDYGRCEYGDDDDPDRLLNLILGFASDC